MNDLVVDERPGVQAPSNDLVATSKRGPVKAVHVLLPLWGHRFIQQFLEFSLPTLLAPGNIPALAAELPCRFVLMTRAEDLPLIREHPSWRRLARTCEIEFQQIDDLVTDGNHTATITLAFARAVRSVGEAMLDTCFIFLVSDYIVADGSLRSVLARVQDGASGVQAGNFQIVAEDAIPLLRARTDRASPALSLSARELMGWSLDHLHPATTANIVNFQLTHNTHTNRLFWRVDENTLIGRFYLMHMIGIRPEVTDFVTGSSCDYSFIPEMCPSDNVAILTDSDDYFVVEMQPRAHEAKHLKWGALEPEKLAQSLSEWTTARHRRNVGSTLVYHRADIPPSLPDVVRQADQFLAIVSRHLSGTPQPFRHHPYWIGSIASHRAATRQAMSSDDWNFILGERPPSGGLDGYLHRLRQRLFGQPPEVTALHPRYPDYQVLMAQIRRSLPANGKVLLVADRPMVFAPWITRLNRDMFSLETDRLLAMPAEQFRAMTGTFDLCVMFLTEGELEQTDGLLQAVAAILGKDGKLILTVSNNRTRDIRDFSPKFAAHAGRLHRFDFALDGVLYVHGSRSRSAMQSGLVQLAEAVRQRSPPHIAVAAAKAGLLGALTLLGNLRARHAHPEPPSHGYCSSVLVAMHPTLPPAKRTMPDLQRSPHQSRWDKEYLRMQSNAYHHAAHRSLVLRDQIGLEQLGLRTNQIWHDDPQGLAAVLARYHFVAKLIAGRRNVAEVGCSDGFGARIVLQEVAGMTLYGQDPIAIEDIRRRQSADWPMAAEVFDARIAPLPRSHDAIYSLDAIQLLSPEEENGFIDNLAASLASDNDVLIVGTPTPEAGLNLTAAPGMKMVARGRHLAGAEAGVSTEPRAHSETRASIQGARSYARTGTELRLAMEKRFHAVFLFSMIEESVLAGSLANATYVLALCCGRRKPALDALA
ncbi:MAG TPA: hypothetical protein VJ740_16445 [Hyphomicrobiaceae bacterium]|nr:hypothetical protein [Hyphomicrobiaceae bacterium]